MKYDLEVTYAGQKVVFKDLEHEDEQLVDESTSSGQAWGVNENNGRIIENFMQNFMCEVKRQCNKCQGTGRKSCPYCHPRLHLLECPDCKGTGHAFT